MTEAGLDLLRDRCLGIVSGYPIATLGRNPAFARHAVGAWVRALADERLGTNADESPHRQARDSTER